MPKYANAATDKSIYNKDIGELTLTDSSGKPIYDSTSDKVFDGSKLADLYSALTGGAGTTLQAVKDTILGTHSTQYGYAVKVNLPEYKTALDLFELNGNHNIVVKLNNQEFAVSFLTTDMNGHVIATLWMTQPLKDDSQNVITSKFGWATGIYTVNYTANMGESYISAAYSTSILRMTVVNGGPADGSETKYAWGTSNANVTSLNVTVDSETRKRNVLAPYTLNNTALIGTKYENKSLIDYITAPKDVYYTYYLDTTQGTGSYYLSDALSKDPDGNFTLSKSVGSTTTVMNNGAHKGYWYSAGALNYANSDDNHYNDWGNDYVWLPTRTEVGSNNTNAIMLGLWETGGAVTNQLTFNKGETPRPGDSPSGAEFVWFREGHPFYPNYAGYLCSSGQIDSGYGSSQIGVRPALHLDLTAADESAVLNKPTADNTQFVYDSMEKTYTPNGYNSNAMDITGNVQTNANEDGYTVSVTPKTGLTWADGTTTAVSFTFIIKKANSVIEPELAYEEMNVNALYNTMQVSDLILMVDPTKNPKPTKGTFNWTCDTTQLIEEGGEYSWEFIPADEYIDNYNTTNGTFTVNNVTADVLKDISVETNEDFDSAEFYTSDNYSVLRNYLKVTAVYQSGLSKTVATYGFGTADGRLNNEPLSAGENVLVPICYETKSKTITIPKVTAVTVESLSLLFIQSTAKIYPTNSIDDLKDLDGVSLIVTATFNNTDTKSIENFELKLVEGTSLKVGANEFYAVYGGVESNTVTVNVSKAVYDTSDLKFEDKLAPYTGNAFDTTGWVTGLPAGVTVSYTCNTDMTEIGTHTVTAHFSGDEENYETIPDMTATLTIENNYALPEIAEDTLFYNPEGNTFEISNFEGVKDIVKLTLNGQTVSDINSVLTQTEIGEYTLEITLTEGKFLGDRESVTLTFAIVKCVVEKPVLVDGGIVYNGKTITPTADNFEFDSLGCYFVSSESGLNAGTYFATFALVDTEHYEWANASVKSAVKYAFADEELNEGEIQVPWTIAKATVSATAEEGKMPAFACATVSDLSKYITYTYYKDELCTEAVAFADLQPDTRYYVKATFTDEDGNFELDDSALGVLGGTAAYDTAPKEPSFIQKAFAYVKANWLYFAIGAVVLLFLILLIIILAATRKKRKERAEERKAEKKEEERQRRAEEREERMMRMQSMQSMGGMPITAAGMIAAQQAQQPMPQPVQQVQQPQPQPVQQVQPVQQAVQQPVAQQPLPVYGQSADSTALLMAKLEAEFARQAQQRSEKELADSKLQTEFDKLRAELRSSGRLPAVGEMHAVVDGQNGDIEMIGMLAAAIWRNIKNNGTAATAERLAGQIQNVQPTESEPAAATYPNNAIITTTTTVDTTNGKESKSKRKGEKIRRSERESFSDLDGFYESYEE